MRMSLAILVLVGLAMSEPQPKMKKRTLEDMDFWMQNGLEGVQRALEVDAKRNKRVAKNIIVFIGDGMSGPTVTAARIYKAQTVHGNFDNPESEQLVLESLEHMGLSKTYCIDYQTPDSASSGTAIFTGVKARRGSLGYDESVDPWNPESGLTATKLETVVDWAQGVGKRTGIVTTTRVTHATPGALYGHVFNRGFECPGALEDDGIEDDDIPDGLHDMAWQLVHNIPGKNVNVVMGGGRPAFMHKDNIDDSDWKSCKGRKDEDLVERWLREHDKSIFVENEQDLVDVEAGKTDYLLGLFSDKHLVYDDEREQGKDPSLANMTIKALEILAKGENGFFLMVEAGRIDHAHHESAAVRALQETVALDLAVEMTMDYLEEIGELDDTLIIVTADHAHTMSISGYAARGVDIRGLSTGTYDDGLPYTILSYANGPGFEEHNIVDEDGEKVLRRDLTDDKHLKDFDFTFTSAGPLKDETHGGDDTVIFAQGPMAHLFHTVHEETHIAHVIAYSACMGPFSGYDERCMLKK